MRMLCMHIVGAVYVLSHWWQYEKILVCVCKVGAVEKHSMSCRFSLQDTYGVALFSQSIKGHVQK